MNSSSINTATRKTIISLFLAFILIAGTITTYSVYGQSNNSPFVTENELQAALADVVTQEDLETALADVVTQEDLETALADVVDAEACPIGTLLQNVLVTTPVSHAKCNLNISGPNVYTVWRDNTLGQNAEIFFRANQLSGTPLNLSNNSGISINSQIAAIGDNVYVTWQDDTPGNHEIAFASSNDKGQTFSIPVNLSNTTGHSEAPQITAIGDNVYVTWADNTSGNFEILFASSNDKGQTFSIPVNLSNNTGHSYSQQILSAGDNVYVVWQDTTPAGETDILFSRSNDNGLTFSIPVNLSNNIAESNEPQISVEGDNVYVVWYDDVIPNNQPDILFSKSNDNGLTFSIPVNLSNNTGHSEAPQISSAGDNVYVVWQDNVSLNNHDIFFSRSNDNGQTFNNPINLSNNVGISEEPQISSEGNNVYVVWFDNTPSNYDIFFTQSNDNGLTFSIPVNLSNNIGDSNEPRISIVGDNVYIVWQDRTPSNYDIFYITNNQDFGTFGNTINISNNAGDSFNPQISSSSS